MPDLQQPTDVSAATPINRILAQAAAAAFANRRDEAHELLQQAIRQAPSSPEVWLACAALAGDPIERLAYLERACALNPTDTRARALAGRARVQVINQLTEQGIAAVRDKSMGAARQHFAEIVRLEPTHEVTWLRLAALAESPEEQVALIKQVLRINPANDKARATLIEAEKQLAQTHLKQASAEIEAGQYANARAALRRSLLLDNTSEDAWSLMALIAEDADERQNAADRLDALRARAARAAAAPRGRRRRRAAVARAWSTSPTARRRSPTSPDSPAVDSRVDADAAARRRASIVERRRSSRRAVDAPPVESASSRMRPGRRRRSRPPAVRRAMVARSRRRGRPRRLEPPLVTAARPSRRRRTPVVVQAPAVAARRWRPSSPSPRWPRRRRCRVDARSTRLRHRCARVADDRRPVRRARARATAAPAAAAPTTRPPAARRRHAGLRRQGGRRAPGAVLSNLAAAQAGEYWTARSARRCARRPSTSARPAAA